jgi:hypothetical protein
MQKIFSKKTRENMEMESMVPQTECKAYSRYGKINNAMQTYLTCTRI